MARRTHEQVVKEYLKEYDRIRKQISRMEKRGFTVTGILPDRKAKKDITSKDLAKLKKLTNKKIYQKSTYEGFSGEYIRKGEQRYAAQKAAETKRKKKEQPPVPPEPEEPPKPPKPPAPPTIPGEEELTDEEQAAIDRFYEDIDRFNSKFAGKMRTWANEIISKYGKKAFGSMLADAYEDGFEFTYQTAYDDAIMIQAQGWLLNYLPATTTEKEREQTEEEWQALIDEIADDEDFFPFD